MGCCKFYFIFFFFLITILFSVGKVFVCVLSSTYFIIIIFFFLVVIHTRCEGNKKPILWETFSNPAISLKSGRVLSHLIEILCEKLFQVPLHPGPRTNLPPNPPISIWGWVGGEWFLRPLALPQGLFPSPAHLLPTGLTRRPIRLVF